MRKDMIRAGFAALCACLMCCAFYGATVYWQKAHDRAIAAEERKLTEQRYAQKLTEKEYQDRLEALGR